MAPLLFNEWCCVQRERSFYGREHLAHNTTVVRLFALILLVPRQLVVRGGARGPSCCRGILGGWSGVPVGFHSTGLGSLFAGPPVG